MDDEEGSGDYRFFLSYARRDAKESGHGENEWFKRLREDLVRDVAREAGLPSNVPEGDVCFFDRDGIDLAQPWRTALLQGLQRSRVIVCLYSPNYFKSDYCGREFEVFQRRVKQSQATGVRVIPVLWDAPSKFPQPLPACLRDIQFEHRSLGETYAEKGVLHLLRLRKEVAYQTFLEQIAERIAEAGRTPLPPAQGIDDLERVPSAFLSVPPRTAAQAEAHGPRVAWLVYVAGTLRDAGVRRDVAGYGGQHFEWQPFHPDSRQTAGALASQVVASKGLLPWYAPIDQGFAGRLRDAERTNTPVVVLVDPWAVEITTFDHVFDAVDRSRLHNCGVIIPWSAHDPELAEPDPEVAALTRGEVLQQRLRAALSHLWKSKDICFVPFVPSESQFREALARAVDDLRQSIEEQPYLQRGRAGDQPWTTLPTPRHPAQPANTQGAS